MNHTAAAVQCRWVLTLLLVVTALSTIPTRADVVGSNTLEEAATPSIQGRLVGGTTIAHEETTLFARSLVRLDSTVRVLGVGTLITKQHILTAASILENQVTVYIRFGNVLVDNAVGVTATHIQRHPEYVLGNITNNLAVVRTPRPFAVSKPIGLMLDTTRYSLSGASVVLASFGMITQSTAAPAQNLHKIYHTVADADFCGYDNQGDDDETPFLCTYDKYERTVPCYYDVGAPVLDATNFALYAIVAHVQDSCSALYGKTHLRVAPYLGWLNATIHTDTML